MSAQQNTSMNPYAPQRIELPLYFNTPMRKDDLVDPGKYRAKSKAGADTSFINNESALNMSYVEPSERILYQKRLKDYSILAFACKRANKLRDEGRAYYSSGVLYDNLGQYQKAITCYQKFRAVCQKIGDTHGTALSYNCIGVAYQKLGEKDPRYYQSAVEYHLKHCQIGDLAGKFIANANLGIVYDLLGDKEKAATYHQAALRCAVQISSLAGQTIAIGNLGRVGAGTSMINDKAKLKGLVQKYLELSAELKHKKGEAEAHIQLGRIEQEERQYRKSVENFALARRIAKEAGDVKGEHEASVRYGIANAEMKWEDKVGDILKNVVQETAYYGY